MWCLLWLCRERDAVDSARDGQLAEAEGGRHRGLGTVPHQDPAGRRQRDQLSKRKNLCIVSSIGPFSYSGPHIHVIQRLSDRI